MKAHSIGLAVCLLVVSCVTAYAAPSPTPSTNLAVQTAPPAPHADGVRPEDVMIDDEAIGDVWDSSLPAESIGITEEDVDLLPTVTAALSSAELLIEQELLKPPRPAPKEPERVRTMRWRPNVPIQTLFYLALAVIVVAVLLLKARG